MKFDSVTSLPTHGQDIAFMGHWGEWPMPVALRFHLHVCWFSWIQEDLPASHDWSPLNVARTRCF